jgi:hypothetical protein
MLVSETPGDTDFILLNGPTTRVNEPVACEQPNHPCE